MIRVLDPVGCDREKGISLISHVSSSIYKFVGFSVKPVFGFIRRNAAPVAHTVRTFPGMVLEFARTPMHRIRQERDWNMAVSRFPEFTGYESEANRLLPILGAAHADYIRNYSAPLISLSLNRAMFLYRLCEIVRPNHILDLGSGFSSYVFRKYQQETSPCNVTSVDDSPEWLEVTGEFLDAHGLSHDGLMSLEAFQSDTKEHGLDGYDLCFLDIGDIALRMELMHVLLDWVINRKGVLVIDDFHVTRFRKFIIQTCRDKNVSLLSLRKHTRRRLSHMAMVVSANKIA